MELTDIFKQTKAAGRKLALLSDERRNEVLQAVADAIMAHTDELLAANTDDLARMDASNPMYDRLLLTTERLADIAADMRHVSALPSPLGRVLKDRRLDNGLHLRRVSVPFGVIGMIYEARPNVTFDVFALCFKSGNACVLKGGKDADDSNRAAVALIHRVLAAQGIDTAAVALLPATHEATNAMLHAVGWIDLCIPRGGKKLIESVRNTAKVPVIETGAGVVNCYLDTTADAVIAADIVFNAKTRRPSVCNALDCLLVHHDRLSMLPDVCSRLAERGVLLHADPQAYAALQELYPAALLQPATVQHFGTEFLGLEMAVKTVSGLDEALAHIAAYGSGHSECIVTEDHDNARKFQMQVDAACVYVNVSTGFTDGAQFGLGAEIGISTQKLGARGPMALEEITTYKWLIEGHGQIRK